MLDHLGLFFENNEKKKSNSKTYSSETEDNLGTIGCWDVYIVHGDGYSYFSYRNNCVDEKGDGEINDEWDEPEDPSIDEDTNDDDDINYYCDGSDPDCEGGGGGSSNSGGSDEDNTTNTGDDQIIISSSFDSSIAGCIFETLQSESGDYKSIIKRFDGEFPVSHIKLTLSNTLPSNVNAATSPPVQYIIEIKLNQNNLNRPTLSIARTIIHETVHAEMFRKLMSILENGGDLDGLTKVQLSNKLSNGDFPGIFDYYTRFGINGFQHEQMAAHYVDTISSILEEYDHGRNDMQLYRDLAWVGLKNTIAWNSKPYSERQRIDDSINNFNLTGDKDCEL